MRKVFVIQILILYSFCSIANSSDTSIFIRKYKLKDCISFKSTVKVTVNEKYSLLMEGKNYINHMSKHFTVLDKYEGFKDTLFIEIQSNIGNNGGLIYGMSIKESSNSNLPEHFSDTLKNNTDFSISSFQDFTINYAVHRLLFFKRIIIFNEETKENASFIIKEKYCWSLGEWSSGAGTRWRIADSKIVIIYELKWVS